MKDYDCKLSKGTTQVCACVSGWLVFAVCNYLVIN